MVTYATLRLVGQNAGPRFPATLLRRCSTGVRRIPLHEFYTGVGDNYRKLQPNELVTRVFLPAGSANYSGVYRKLRVRGSIDYPLAGVAVAIRRTNGHVADARVAITAVNPAPMLLKGATAILAGKAMDDALAEAVGDLAAKTAKPLTTSALTPEYRREMIRVLMRCLRRRPTSPSDILPALARTSP